MSSLEEHSKTVEIMGGTYSPGLSTQTNRIINDHIREGWTLFAINTANCKNGTPFALITFVR